MNTFFGIVFGENVGYSAFDPKSFNIVDLLRLIASQVLTEDGKSPLECPMDSQIKYTLYDNVIWEGERYTTIGEFAVFPRGLYFLTPIVGPNTAFGSAEFQLGSVLSVPVVADENLIGIGFVSKGTKQFLPQAIIATLQHRLLAALCEGRFSGTRFRNTVKLYLTPRDFEYHLESYNQLRKYIS